MTRSGNWAVITLPDGAQVVVNDVRVVDAAGEHLPPGTRFEPLTLERQWVTPARNHDADLLAMLEAFSIPAADLALDRPRPVPYPPHIGKRRRR